MQPADDAAVGALEHLHDLAHGAAAMVAAHRAHRGTVAVHEAAHLGGRKKDRRPDRSCWLIRDEEAMAVRMAFDPPGDDGDALGDEQGAGAVLHHLAGALKLSERGVESSSFRSVNSQPSAELIRGERRARRVQRIENFPLARNALSVCSIAPAKRGSFGFFL